MHPAAKPKKGSIIEFFGFKKKSTAPTQPLSVAAAQRIKSPDVCTPEQQEEMEERSREWFAHEREALEK